MRAKGTPAPLHVVGYPGPDPRPLDEVTPVGRAVGAYIVGGHVAAFAQTCSCCLCAIAPGDLVVEADRFGRPADICADCGPRS